MIKICCFCQKFSLDMGYEDWSEDTPGEDAQIQCDKRYWRLKNHGNVEDRYRENIKMAATCPDYDPVTSPRKRKKQNGKPPWNG